MSETFNGTMKQDPFMTKREKLDLVKVRQAECLRQERLRMHSLKSKRMFENQAELARSDLRLHGLETEYQALLDHHKERKEKATERLHSKKHHHLRTAVMRVRDRLESSIDLARKLRDRQSGDWFTSVDQSSSPKGKETSREEVKHVLVQRGTEIMRLHIVGEGSESPKRDRESPRKERDFGRKLGGPMEKTQSVDRVGEVTEGKPLRKMKEPKPELSQSQIIERHSDTPKSVRKLSKKASDLPQKEASEPIKVSIVPIPVVSYSEPVAGHNKHSLSLPPETIPYDPSPQSVQVRKSGVDIVSDTKSVRGSKDIREMRETDTGGRGVDRRELGTKMMRYWKNRVKPDFQPNVMCSFFVETLRGQELDLRRKLMSLKRIPLPELTKGTSAGN